MTEIAVLFAGLRQMEAQEWERLDAAAARSLEHLRQATTALPGALQPVAEQAVEACYIAAGDLRPETQAATQARVQQSVARAVLSAGQMEALQWQSAFLREWAAALDEVYAFSVAFDRLMEHLAHRTLNGGNGAGALERLTPRLKAVWDTFRDGAPQHAELQTRAGQLAALTQIPHLAWRLREMALTAPENATDVGSFKQSIRRATVAAIAAHTQETRTEVAAALELHVATQFDVIKGLLSDTLDAYRAHYEALPPSALKAAAPYMAIPATPPPPVAPPPPPPQAQPPAANVCSQCGAPLRSGARFCGQCGATAAPPPPSPAAKAGVCYKCGAPVGEGARCCGQCGAAIIAPARPGAATPGIYAALDAARPELTALLAQGERIIAIRRVREISGWELQKATDYLKTLESSVNQ